MNNIELNQGEIKLTLDKQNSGKLSLAELGVKSDAESLKSGLLRLVFDFKELANQNFFQVPTIEVCYQENMAETQWICEFNGKTILEKLDHHGHSTVLLLNRNELSNLEQHHENVLIVHAEFPEAANLDLEKSFVHFFK